MAAGNRHLKLYFLTAVVMVVLLLVLMLKFRKHKDSAIILPNDYQFQPWIGTKEQWLRSDSNKGEIRDISLVEELKNIKAYRMAKEKILSDGNEFKIEDVKTIRFHIVQESDTLSEISKKYYGTSRRWRDIFEANKDVISNPDFLEKGTKLIIPD